ncbi:MAG TPA: zinc ribbon domain-containing protein [Planctomycetota bacterium]|nr:zinc ribbon domain-containing protein [Planctomycetota bacterium]
MKTAFLLILCLGVPGLGEFRPALGAAVQDATCPECKGKLKPDAKFCPSCGAKIEQKLCAGCKALLKPGAKFCPSCGMKVEEAPAPKPDPKADPKPDPKPDAAPRPAPEAGSKPPAPQDAATPVGRLADADSVKQKLDEELRKFGTSSEEVNRAIDRGAAYLAAHYLKNQFGSDEDYLGAYALIHTNQYFANGKLREKIGAFLRSDRWLKSGSLAYTAGLRALALEATHDPDLKALTRECAEYLVEAQGPKGTWTYRADVPITPVKTSARDAESGVTISGGEPLDEEPKGELVGRQNTSKNASDGDTSCTQFAILGLHAAARCGYLVPKTVWEQCLKEMEARRCKDGGWHYHGPADKAYGSMTCAGICTVALCRFYLGEKDYLETPSIQGGLKWLGANFAVDKNPNETQWALYYLYSVERVGVFASTDRIGEHAWYGKGAKHLVTTQTADGSWIGQPEGKEKGTAFALLFLTRATSPVKAIRRGGNGWLETHPLNDASNFMIILDASGSMHEEIDGREKVDIAKDVIESIVKHLGEGARVGLRVYGHRYDALNDLADVDTELVFPVGPIQPATFMAKVRSLKSKGKTPLTLSIDETIKDVASVDSELDLVTIILTDGGESTRGARPYEAAARLAASRKGMKVHIVGFDINEDDWREQLEKTAAAGNGKYFHVRKASELMTALQLVTVGAGDYTLLDKAGKEAARGKLGDRRELPEGKYTLVIAAEGKREEKTVWINTGVVTHATVSLAKILKK